MLKPDTHPALNSPLPTFAILVVLNAVIQSLLIIPAPIFGIESGLFLLLAAASTFTLLLTAAFVVGTILRTSDDRYSLSNAWRTIRPNLWRFVGWTGLWLAAIVIGLLFFVVPGFVIGAAFVFVPLAVADGQRRPITVNFQAIRKRPAGFLAATLASGVALFFLYLVGAALAFLLPPVAAAFITWCCVGLAGAWLIRSWVLLYQSPAKTKTHN